MKILMVLIFSAFTSIVFAGSDDSSQFLYKIQPGDVLKISVWREPELQKEVMVRPDGGIALPLAGDVMASGKTAEQLRLELVATLQPMIPDLDVTVSVAQSLGNRIYVIGKVNKPGEFVLVRQVDVMQALSMAMGMAKFAEVEEIKILRRVNSQQQMLKFNYTEVKGGVNLAQNIILQSGDVVVVP